MTWGEEGVVVQDGTAARDVPCPDDEDGVTNGADSMSSSSTGVCRVASVAVEVEGNTMVSIVTGCFHNTGRN